MQKLKDLLWGTISGNTHWDLDMEIWIIMAILGNDPATSIKIRY